MKLLVTGKTGQVGTAVVKLAKRQNVSVYATGREEFTVHQTDSFNTLLTREKPDIVIHTAASTQVDRAESEEHTAWEINAIWPGQIAQACAQHAIPLLHVSTDFVFSGQKKTPYTEDDLPHPINLYGKSKLAGEIAVRANLHHHVILRVAWVYSETGKNFCKTILRLATEKESLSVVNDQTGTPTTAMDIAHALLHIAHKIYTKEGHFGTYHFTAKGHTTWFGFASEILSQARHFMPLRAQEIHPITTEEYPTPAQRPRYTVLDTTKVFRDYGISGSPWKEGVQKTIPRLMDVS